MPIHLARRSDDPDAPTHVLVDDLSMALQLRAGDVAWVRVDLSRGIDEGWLVESLRKVARSESAACVELRAGSVGAVEQLLRSCRISGLEVVSIHEVVVVAGCEIPPAGLGTVLSLGGLTSGLLAEAERVSQTVAHVVSDPADLLTARRDGYELHDPVDLPPVPWLPDFLAALRRNGNVRLACQLANVDRAHAYSVKRRDPLVELLWNQAVGRSGDRAA